MIVHIHMMAVKSDPNFHSEKARVLGKVDLSRKGSVDEPITELVGFINSLKDFYTTSSCSGRLTVHQEVPHPQIMSHAHHVIPSVIVMTLQYLIIVFICRKVNRKRRVVIGG